MMEEKYEDNNFYYIEREYLSCPDNWDEAMEWQNYMEDKEGWSFHKEDFIPAGSEMSYKIILKKHK